MTKVSIVNFSVQLSVRKIISGFVYPCKTWKLKERNIERTKELMRNVAILIKQVSSQHKNKKTSEHHYLVTCGQKPMYQQICQLTSRCLGSRPRKQGAFLRPAIVHFKTAYQGKISPNSALILFRSKLGKSGLTFSVVTDVDDSLGRGCPCESEVNMKKRQFVEHVRSVQYGIAPAHSVLWFVKDNQMNAIFNCRITFLEFCKLRSL